MLDKADRLFRNDDTSTFVELLQNSRRAGAGFRGWTLPVHLFIQKGGGMFSELMPLIQHRPLTLTIAAIDEKQIRVNVVPTQTDKDKAANKKIGYAHNKEVAPIPDTAIAALTTPLSLTGTPEEIDAQLAKTLTEFTAIHVGLQNTFDAAAGAIARAVKEIDERERLKKEQDKARNKKAEPPKAEEKKPEPESLPSLFTAPPAQTAVSANDASNASAGGEV